MGEIIIGPVSNQSGGGIPGHNTQKEEIERFKISLTDKDARTRAIACLFFNRMAQKNPKSIPDEVIPLLIKNLSNRTLIYGRPGRSGRYYAADTLRKIGKRAADCLMKELNDPNSEISILGKNDPETVKLTQRIIELINEDDNHNDKVIKENINVKK